MADVLEMVKDALAKVEQLDEVIDSASDQKGAGRRAVINRLVNDNEGNVKDLVAQIVDGFADEPDQVKFGVYFGLKRELSSVFDEQALAFADSLVESRPEAEKASADEVKKANEERTKLVTVIKNLKGVLEVTDPAAAEGIKVPRKRPTGGARGKRAISFYTWTKDGEPFDGGITDLAKALGYERPADLRDQMKAAEINLTKPPAVINFTTPAGVVLIGTRSADAPDFDSDEVDTDENGEDEDEVSEDEDTSDDE